MSVYYCALCDTAHDSVGDATRCCSEEFDDDGDDDQGAAPVAMADSGQVRACPECDEPDPKPRVFSDRARDPDSDHDYACQACGARFDEPHVRKAYVEDRNGRRGLAGDLEDASPDDLRADGGTPGSETDHDDLRADGGTTTRRRQSDPDANPCTATIQYLRELIEPGDSQIVLARHVSSATSINSHKAGRVLARLAGDTESLGELDGDQPDDLVVERDWEGSNAVRWRVTRTGLNGSHAGTEGDR